MREDGVDSEEGVAGVLVLELMVPRLVDDVEDEFLTAAFRRVEEGKVGLERSVFCFLERSDDIFGIVGEGGVGVGSRRAGEVCSVFRLVGDDRCNQAPQIVG